MNDNIQSQAPVSPKLNNNDISTQIVAEVRAPHPENPAPDLHRKPRGLRLWPAPVIVAVQFLVVKSAFWLELPAEALFPVFMFTPMVGTLLFATWWLFFSRVAWNDRLLALSAAIVGGVSILYLSHPTVGGFGIIMSGLAILTGSWSLWLLASFLLPWKIRRVGLLLTIVLAWTYMGLIRTDRILGDFHTTSNWRWSPTAEDRLKDAPIVVNAEVVKLQPGDWPAFRGADRDGKLTGVRIDTDWTANPPSKVWKNEIGPGWSSFAVIGDRLFTQEQRGRFELVVCYNANTGDKNWEHKDEARFEETVAGPGPRATPTFHDGKIYALGAKGVFNCLDAKSGQVVWSKDVTEDSKGKIPMWGFSSSPLIIEGLAIVHAGRFNNDENPGHLLAYDAKTGELKWLHETGKYSYCSPQAVKLYGVEQVLFNSDVGLTSFNPRTGEVLWQDDWAVKDLARIVQPAVVDETDVLVGTGFDQGTSRVHISRDGERWLTKTTWAKKSKFSPYYNDFVLYQGHIYGPDGSTTSYLTCVNIADGKSKWRARGPGNGYGHGQVLLLADQGLLLVLSEKDGRVTLVEASPKEHKVVSSFQALSDNNRAWSHPVIAHGKLYVRNENEIACFQLKEIK